MTKENRWKLAKKLYLEGELEHPHVIESIERLKKLPKNTTTTKKKTKKEEARLTYPMEEPKNARSSR